MPRSRWIVFSPLLLAASLPARAATLIVNDLGDAGSGVCASTCTLRDAIASALSGDTIGFATTLAYPAMITLGGQELLAYKNLTFAGPGAALLSINGNGQSRIFEIAANASVSVSGLTLTNGVSAGTFGTPSSPNGGPAYGGAVLVNAGSTLQLLGCELTGNIASGGGGSFFTAGSGGAAYGGAIYNAGILLIADTTLSGNAANGGYPPPPAPGPAGNGGDAFGGAIYATGLTEVNNSQFLQNAAQGAPGAFNFFGSAGGNGGSAQGGALAASGFTALSFVSAVGNSSAAGSGGFGTPVGNAGSATGSDIYSTATVLSRYVALTSTSGGGATTCSIATSSTQGANLDADGSCPNFSLHGDAKLQILTSGGQTFAFPLWGSPLIDVEADCKDAFGATLTSDVRDGVRPLDGNADGVVACDLGAVESDELFANGFE